MLPYALDAPRTLGCLIGQFSLSFIPQVSKAQQGAKVRIQTGGGVCVHTHAHMRAHVDTCACTPCVCVHAHTVCICGEGGLRGVGPDYKELEES